MTGAFKRAAIWCMVDLLAFVVGYALLDYVAKPYGGILAFAVVHIEAYTRGRFYGLRDRASL